MGREEAVKVLTTLPIDLPPLNTEYLADEEFQSKNVYSHVDNCKIIDEWMHAAFTGMGMPITYVWHNVRLLFALLACLISFHAYYGLGWPENRPKMACCVALFWILQSMVIYIDKFVLSGTICAVRWGFGRRVFFNAKLSKASESIDMSVRTESPEIRVHRPVPVGNIFCADGTLVQKKLHEQFQELIAELKEAVQGTKKTN
jgi:hypothetical protein